MRTARVEVFTFDELTEKAREKAHEKWVEDACGTYVFDREARQTIEAFEKEFGVTVADWEFDAWTYSFDLRTGSIYDDVLALCGNRARAWFWNNHGHCLLEPRIRYFTHDRDGRRIEAVSADSVEYRSKVDFTRVYDGTCPWTGYYLDACALDPIAYFCFGVEWDDKAQKRVPSGRKLAADNAVTVEYLLEAGCDSLFSALRDDCKYQQSMEAFKEACEANLYEFTEDGEMWCKKEVA